MQVPMFVSIVAASCILGCCGGFFVRVELGGLSLFLSNDRHFLSINACVKSLTGPPPTKHGTGTCLHAHIFIGTALRLSVLRPPTRGGLGTPKIFGTGASINLGPPCLHDQNMECRAKNHRHGAGILECRANFLACVNGV